MTVPAQKVPLVSIVTPLYNGEKYLAGCIESVLAQTYQNWEYIIVNNCSTDHSVEIAKGYEQKAQRIHVYNNRAHLGMAENHNVALRYISPLSKYCKVLHADDWLFPECLMRMVEVAEANPSVGVVSSYGLSGVRVAWDGLPYPSTFMSGREICRRSLLAEIYVFGSPTSHLIRADLIRTRREFYNSNPFHVQYSDQEACYEVLQNSDFGFVHQVQTFTRIHAESSTAAVARSGLNSDFPAGLNILTKYGPIYLGKEEYEWRLGRVMKKYYSFLARSVFKLRGKQFWDYHRKALSHVGYPLSFARLLIALCSQTIDLLLNVKQTAEIIIARMVRSAARRT